MARTQARPATQAPASARTYASLLVHAEPGARSARRVEVAASLAREFGARLIGLGAETFEAMATADPFLGYAAGEWVGLVQKQIGRNLEEAEAEFRRDAAGADIEWRTVQDFPGRALASAARAADLIVMSPKGKGGAMHAADPAEVIMTAGRPVLLAPDTGKTLRGECVFVAWKDSREARRALADAMPFLKRAREVVVQAVCEAEAVKTAVLETDDVTAYLERHGVAARSNVCTVSHHGVTEELTRLANVHDADLIVAGAYGHSRMQEWAFGGVTDDLVRRPPCFVLMSH